MKQKNTDEHLEVTVYDYFVKHRKIPLPYSGNLPCICVGRSKNPAFLPIEVVLFHTIIKLVINLCIRCFPHVFFFLVFLP